MKNTYKKIFTSLALISMLAACDSSSDNSNSSDETEDANLFGTWIQVTALADFADRDTFSFSSDGANLNTISTLPTHANNGQIWEDFDTEKIYQYSYQLVGDTLWVQKYELGEDDAPIAINLDWGIAFVKLASYVAPAEVDPFLIGNWIEATSSSYVDTVRFTATQFTYNNSGTGNAYVLGTDGALFAKEGLIGITGEQEYEYNYRIVGDTLMLNSCSSFCSELKMEFNPADKYIRLP